MAGPPRPTRPAAWPLTVSVALVSMFRAGLLHHRKGATNWEYVLGLSPDLPWRPVFLELTRRFDEAWYGLGAANREAADGFGAEAQRILGALRAGGGRA